MIWAVATLEAVLIAACIYQIRELTSRINTVTEMLSGMIDAIRKANSILAETTATAKKIGEATVIMNGKISNNEHRIRDIYKAINELKGWPSVEVPQK